MKVGAHYISKQQEESWKFDVQWRTCDEALSVQRCNKLLSRVFASSEAETIYTKEAYALVGRAAT